METFGVPIAESPERLDAAEVIAFGPTTTDVLVLNRGGVLAGWSAADDHAAGTGATIELYDGADANGELVDTLVLAAKGADRVWFALPGVRIERGCAVHVVSGTVHGSVYIRP